MRGSPLSVQAKAEVEYRKEYAKIILSEAGSGFQYTMRSEESICGKKYGGNTIMRRWQAR